MSANRLDYIDILKGFAIFLMVMAHILIGIKGNYEQTVSNIIYTFHMPLFMFMSGYVFDLNRKISYCMDNFLCVIRKRFCTLIIPGTIWMLLEYVFNDCTELTFPWFLRTLFEIIVTVYLIMWITAKVKANMISNIIALSGLYVLFYIIKHLIDGTIIDNVVNMARLQIFYPYFAFGYIFRRYGYERFLDKYNVFTISLILFVFCIFIRDVMYLSHGLDALLRYIVAISGIMICYCTAKQASKDNQVIKTFKYLGFYQ